MRAPSARRATARRDAWLELASLPLLLLLWQVVAMAVGHRLFPTPIVVSEAFLDLAISGPLLADLWATLKRAALGFLIAMGCGTLIGIALGRVPVLDRLLSGWLLVGLNLPAIVAAIVLYIWLGLTETALVAAVVVNKTPLVIATVREGVRSFDRGYEELARALRLTPIRHLRLIILPQLAPYLFVAARTGLSLIWKIVLVFEVLGSDGGVGYRVSVMFQMFDITGILAYTSAFILVVLAFEHGVLRPLETIVLAWRPAPQSQ